MGRLVPVIALSVALGLMVAACSPDDVDVRAVSDSLAPRYPSCLAAAHAVTAGSPVSVEPRPTVAYNATNALPGVRLEDAILSGDTTSDTSEKLYFVALVGADSRRVGTYNDGAPAVSATLTFCVYTWPEQNLLDAFTYPANAPCALRGAGGFNGIDAAGYAVSDLARQLNQGSYEVSGPGNGVEQSSSECPGYR